MLLDAAPAVHALLRVTHPDALIWDAGRPHWAESALQLAPWAVIRRAAPRPGLWPVGVRGGLRSQRAAAWLPHRAAGECITPQRLAATRAWREHPRATATPAVAVLDEVAAILVTHGFAGRWGPGGSVGFELASGVRCTTPDSDLDLVLSAELPVARTDAARLHTDLSKLPVRIDLLLETPRGAAVLAEYGRGVDVILLRSAQGPRLVRDPWNTDDSRVATP
jgi:phosphoribosyl-dephospho-CoA transferase